MSLHLLGGIRNFVLQSFIELCLCTALPLLILGGANMNAPDLLGILSAGEPISNVFMWDHRLQRLTPCCTLLPYVACMINGFYRMVCDIVQPRRDVYGPYCCTNIECGIG